MLRAIASRASLSELDPTKQGGLLSKSRNPSIASPVESESESEFGFGPVPLEIIADLFDHFGYKVLSPQADFPIEAYLVNPHSNYWKDRGLGKGTRLLRKFLDREGHCGLHQPRPLATEALLTRRPGLGALLTSIAPTRPFPDSSPSPFTSFFNLRFCSCCAARMTKLPFPLHNPASVLSQP